VGIFNCKSVLYKKSVTYSFINVPVLELHKSSADCGDVTLLIGESHSTSTLNETIRIKLKTARYILHMKSFLTYNLFLNEGITFFFLIC